MQGEKDLLVSRATIGAVVLLATIIAQTFGLDIGDQEGWVDAVVKVIEAGVALAGFVLVLIGRARAVKRIGSIAGVKLGGST